MVHGCVKKDGSQSIGKSRGDWTTKIHMVAADARTAMTFSLSPGQAHGAPESPVVRASVPLRRVRRLDNSSAVRRSPVDLLQVLVQAEGRQGEAAPESVWRGDGSSPAI